MNMEPNIDISSGISCDCCEESTTELPFSSAPSNHLSQATRVKIESKPGKVNKAYRDDDEFDGDDDDISKQRKIFDNTRLLIVVGITATVPIVLLELLVPDSLVSTSIMLILASSVQILLGRPFYVRFFRNIRNRRKLTTDTLVVLSTSVAYSYSIVNFLIGSNLQTVVAVFVDNKLIGLIAVADTLRANAADVIKEIKKSGKDVLLISGDNNITTQAIARKVGIDKFMAQVLPQHKRQVISKLQSEGKVVMMVGDGINDAPALAAADIGIAMGSGTDVAVSSGHVILMKGDLEHLLYTLKLGSYSLKKIKQNLSISFAYNVITISIAAGLFYGLTNSLILTPGLAALGWVVSDTAVFGNSLFMRKFNCSTIKSSGKVVEAEKIHKK